MCRECVCQWVGVREAERVLLRVCDVCVWERKMKFCALGVGRVCECERDGNGQVTRQKEQKRMKDNKYYKMVVF
jgi:hypothetical protein